MLRLACVAAALAAFAAPLAAEFKPAVNLDVRARYENQPSPAQSGWGQSANLLMIPAFSFGSHSLLPVLGVLQQGRGTERVEAGAPELFFTRRNTFIAKPTWRMDGETWVNKAWLGAKRAVNAEAHDTAWSLGLYDWEEFAAGYGLDRKMESYTLGGGLELQHRSYMNWREVVPDAFNGKNTYSKDYNALKANLEARSAPGAKTWKTELTWLAKAHSDDYVVKRVTGVDNQPTTDGTRDFSALRLDNLIRAGVDLGFAGEDGSALDLDFGVDYNLSNQNYFDGVYTKGVLDFYGYLSVGGGIRLSAAPWGKDSLRLGFRPGLHVRQYTGRPVRSTLGSYSNLNQRDTEMSLELDFSYPLPVAGLSLVGGATQLMVRSNQMYSSGSQNDYDLFSATAGLSYRL